MPPQRRQPEDGEGEDGVERDLGGQAPRLAEGGDPGVGDIDLEPCGVQEPVAQRWMGEDHDGGECEPVRGENPGGPAKRVAQDLAPVQPPTHEATVQEEAREREEDSHPEVPARPEAAHQPTVDAEAGEVGDVGQHDHACSHGPKAVQ